jgi:hypothetical protein
MARFLRRLLLLALLGVSVAAAVRALRGRGRVAAMPDAGPSWPTLNGATTPPIAPTTAATEPVAASAAGEQPTWVGAVDGSCPDGYPVKANSSGIYHVPGGQFYGRTVPERCYPDPQAAEADGYRAARR